MKLANPSIRNRQPELPTLGKDGPIPSLPNVGSEPPAMMSVEATPEKQATPARCSLAPGSAFLRSEADEHEFIMSRLGPFDADDDAKQKQHVATLRLIADEIDQLREVMGDLLTFFPANHPARGPAELLLNNRNLPADEKRHD